MTNKFHKNLTLDDNHTLNARTYPDIAARDASVDGFDMDPLNINKIVRVDDNGETIPKAAYFLLVSIGPAVWTEITSTGFDTFLELLDTPPRFPRLYRKRRKSCAGQLFGNCA